MKILQIYSGNIFPMRRLELPYSHKSYLDSVFSVPLLGLLLRQTYAAVLEGGEHCGGHLSHKISGHRIEKSMN